MAEERSDEYRRGELDAYKEQYRRGVRDAHIDASLQDFARRLTVVESTLQSLDSLIDALKSSVNRMEEAWSIHVKTRRDEMEKQITARQFYVGLGGFLVMFATLLVSVVAAVGGFH